ncbi:DUF4336 domain-containing protein [uncultured Roseovarius sp.]|uniref:DUF4336 domain-containing protein n=1 Tax=uncultured Roseovarius sp. TaxID=293344 RepID=UPI0026134487|nr:DUF4336 domain-containing protein [uncultured Roseovarius sp.]
MTTYPPLGTLKPVAERIWVVDGPAVICRRMPISTRATVVQLSEGDLWVHSPTGLCDELRNELATLGPVTHLVAPNWDHVEFLTDWREAYPQAWVWGVPSEGARGQGIAFDHSLGGETPWMTEISHLIVGGSKKYREAVFCHRPSATLIVADLMQNFDTARLPTWMRPLIWLAGTDDSDGKMPYLMRRRYNGAELGKSIENMIDWNPRTLILSHGNWYETGAVRELERAFKKLLHERQWSRAMDDVDKGADR